MNTLLSRVMIGVDPGPTTGITAFGLVPYHKNDGYKNPLRILGGGHYFFQCNAAAVPSILTMLIEGFRGIPITVVCEAWVPSPKLSAATAKVGAVTQDVIMTVARGVGSYNETRGIGTPVVHYVERRACDVKPWATDERLGAAGLLAPTKDGAMRHARDAGRHALFSAHTDHGLGDPLILTTSDVYQPTN